MRVRFRDGHEGSGPQVVRGLEYHAPRDVAGDPGAYDLLAGDCALGNTICFDRASLHGALAETVPRETVRRFTPGMTAPDGRIGHRGDWAAGERGQIGAAGYREGDPIAGDVFPRL